MTEAQYNELCRKADSLEGLKNEVAKLRVLQITPSPRTFNDSASYAIGRDMYTQWTQRGLGINAEMAAQALKDDSQGFSQMTDAQASRLLHRFQQNFVDRQNAGLQQNIEAGEKFMHELGRNKSVYTTASGLKYRKLKDGNGKRPKATDRVRVHYTGTLIDGKKFDSSVDRGTPITFRLDEVIPGWTEGLQLMDEGSKYILYLPYNLGYGEHPAGTIPAGSTLIFEVELLEINPK
ncbi:MAG: FKBP-type peptidyl-prolyl cis-trans isomerase [Bacteroidales bacterium]|nr:FKBP-type peptidyl-prolyl cis-trans isomerase [Bacteroidales bacterium]